MDIATRQLDEYAIAFSKRADGFDIEADYSLAWSILMLPRLVLALVIIATILADSKNLTQWPDQLTSWLVLFGILLIVASYFAVARQYFTLRHPVLTSGVSIAGIRFKSKSFNVNDVIRIFAETTNDPGIGSLVVKIRDNESSGNPAIQVTLGQRLPYDRCRIIATLITNALKGAG